ncbi:MAG: TIGR03032 family protein [Alphaproteobacteria bacterium]
MSASRGFESWLASAGVSLAFTTYQAGKLFLLGVQPSGRLSVFERTFERCMGLYADDRTLWMSSIYQLWRFENALEPGQMQDGYDAVYLPQVAYTTGDLDIHDLMLDPNGKPIFCATLFNCLGQVSETHSFQPVWKPPFISKLAAEDRCHMNGLAGENGAPAYVTMVSRSDAVDGWRDRRTDGGLVMDARSGEVVASGFSMPHSPRLANGKLYILDSGTGLFGTVDPSNGKFEEITFCPGFARGLSIVGDYALIGLSLPRDNKTFSGLPLDDALNARDVSARCGLIVVDLKSGDAIHWVRLEGMVTEIYDVAQIKGISRPMAIGTRTDDIRRMISLAPSDVE